MTLALGARIIMACRDIAKAENAMREIIEESGNQNIVIRKLDLSDTKSIKEFAEVINRGKFVFSGEEYIIKPKAHSLHTHISSLANTD